MQLVAEGSLVHLPGGLGGDVADVSPDLAHQPELVVEGGSTEAVGDAPPAGILSLPHRVYRYGLALATAWPLNGEAPHA